MSANGFVIIPTAVFYAQEQGFITSEMADCLSLLYRWREHDSNIIHAVSAERLKRGLSLLRPEYGAGKVQFPTAQALRNWMRGLWEAGWFTRDYVPGVERTYNVYLQIMGGSTHTFVEYAIGHPKGWAQRWAPSEIEGWAKEAISLSNIKHWKLTSAFQGRAPDVPSFLIEGCTPTPILNDTKDQYPSAASAAGVPPVVPTAGEIVPPAFPLVDPVHTCGDVSSSPTFPLSNSNPSTGKATPAGRGKLLKTLYTVQAAELKNTVALPRNRHSRVDMTETAYGFEPVVEDFTKWCRENFERHPKYPLFDYLNIVGERLGAPSVPDPSASNAADSADDPRLTELSQYVWSQTKFAIDPRKTAKLIAKYGYEYVYGVFKEAVCKKENHKVDIDPQWVKTLFTEKGGLALITAYRDTVWGNALLLVLNSARDKSADMQVAVTVSENICRKLPPATLIQLSEAYTEQQETAEAAKKAADAQKSEKAKQKARDWEAFVSNKLPQRFDLPIDLWFQTNPPPKDYRVKIEDVKYRAHERRVYELVNAIQMHYVCSQCSSAVLHREDEKCICDQCGTETIPVIPAKDGKS